MIQSPLYYSIIVPVYNRPEELDQLLHSIALQEFEGEFEILVVEDGSQKPALEVVERSPLRSRISYYQKKNTGPGDSRNYGMSRAKGSYYLLFDSDCILPKDYLATLDRELTSRYVDFFGGPDDALPSFSPLQRAINFVMTSKVTTGGVRGGASNRFEPRSFNMGLSKEVFESTGGFGVMHPGEDPELSMRAWKSGFKSRLIPSVKVYHQRRISFFSFARQVFKFGAVRPILEQMHPEFKRSVYVLPSLFTLYIVILALSLIMTFSGELHELIMLIMSAPLILYVGALKMDVLLKYRSLHLTALTVAALFIQMGSYGVGYFLTYIKLRTSSHKSIQELFPQYFFTVESKVS